MRDLALRTALALLACAPALQAQQLSLYLTDGTRLAVREFEILDSRVRYFSTDRGQWEEVPSEIVDMTRTDAHNRRERAKASVREEQERRERQAERRARTELHAVPLDNGVYYLRGGEPVPLEQAFWDIGRSKKRGVLNVIAPVPLMAGKQTLSIKGLQAKTVTSGDKPAFYLRLDSFSRFGISRVEPEKGRGRRVVQRIYTVPKAEEQFENQDEVEVFRQQLAPLVYKIWPVDPLPDGEYAVVDFTTGKSDLRVWDFSHRSAPAP